MLNYVGDGDRYVVFASGAGEAEVMLAGERFRVRAREAEGAERERRIAVVVLERA